MQKIRNADVDYFLNGLLAGVFGTSAEAKSKFENSVAKKSETEGIIVYHRSDAGRRYSLLDDVQFPERIQGYARIASISDYAYYAYPENGKLGAPDGELAVLLDAFALPGSILRSEESSVGEETVKSSFKGLNVANYPIQGDANQSSILAFLSEVGPNPYFPKSGLLIYVDRAFNVKGVGVVVLGFILSGKVQVHDKLRLIPSATEAKSAEVRGIQISDEDYDAAGRGIRVGLSLKGVDVKDLSKVSWLDDGSLTISNKMLADLRRSPYYKSSMIDRDLHLQICGELLTCRISIQSDQRHLLTVGSAFPFWEGMRFAILDLNAKALRVAGGGKSLSP